MAVHFVGIEPDPMPWPLVFEPNGSIDAHPKLPGRNLSHGRGRHLHRFAVTLELLETLDLPFGRWTKRNRPHGQNQSQQTGTRPSRHTSLH